MPKCYNCGKDQLGALVQLSQCSAPSCWNKLHVVEGSTANFYCPTHQREFPKKIKDLENKVAKLEREVQSRGSIIPPTQETQELRTENQRLTNSLTLKDREQADLQAQIRALNSQLSERENNQPSQLQIRKLADQLELVKNKLTQWTQLLTNHD